MATRSRKAKPAGSTKPATGDTQKTTVKKNARKTAKAVAPAAHKSAAKKEEQRPVTSASPEALDPVFITELDRYLFG